MKHVVTMHPERRGAERRAIILGTTIEDEDVRPAVVLIDDISAVGFGMISVVPLAPGDLITVELPRIGERRATVVRQSGMHFGCAFAVEITTDELQQVLRAGAERHALKQQRAASGWRPSISAVAA